MPSLSEIWEVASLHGYNTRLVVLSTLLLGLASGLVGAFLLLRKRSLMGDALSHATLPGIGIAFGVMVAAGGSGKWMPGLLLGAVLSGLAGVVVMRAVSATTRLKEDAAMGIVLSVFFGLGVAVLQSVRELPGASSAGLRDYIYGKAASVVMSDFLLIAGVAVAVVAVVLVLFKELALLCFDESFAASQGWPVGRLDMILLLLVTAVTVVGLQAVGLILIIAFLITPAAAARFWTNRVAPMALLSAGIGALSGWLGASLSALLPDFSAGAVIVLVASTIFVVSMIFAPRRGVLARARRHRHLRLKVDRQHLLRAAYEVVEAEARKQGPTAPVANRQFALEDLQSKRTWSPRHLARILRREGRFGHVAGEEDGRLRLTEAGFGEAARITRNHRLWELYLVTHADIAPSHVDRDADMVEHVLDADLVQRLEEELRERNAWIPVPPSPHPLGG